MGRVGAAAPPPPVLTGLPVSGMAYLDRPRLAGYFLFSDLSVRHEGQFRFVFNLYEQNKFEKDKDPGASEEEAFDHRTQFRSSIFGVYSAKRFPGLTQSTDLSRTIQEQGCRVRLRRDVRMRRRNKVPAGDCPRDRKKDAECVPRDMAPTANSDIVAQALRARNSASGRMPGAPSREEAYLDHPRRSPEPELLQAQPPLREDRATACDATAMLAPLVDAGGQGTQTRPYDDGLSRRPTYSSSFAGSSVGGSAFPTPAGGTWQTTVETAASSGSGPWSTRNTDVWGSRRIEADAAAAHDPRTVPPRNIAVGFACQGDGPTLAPTLGEARERRHLSIADLCSTVSPSPSGPVNEGAYNYRESMTSWRLHAPARPPSPDDCPMPAAPDNVDYMDCTADSGDSRKRRWEDSFPDDATRQRLVDGTRQSDSHMAPGGPHPLGYDEPWSDQHHFTRANGQVVNLPFGTM